MPRRTRSNGGATEEENEHTPKRTRTENESGVSDEKDGRSGKSTFSDEDFKKKNKVLKTDETAKSSELAAQFLDLHLKNNLVAHHTEDYETDGLVVRRGQAFDITVTFSRTYNKDQDIITLQFTVGNRPLESKGTVIRLPVGQGNITNDSDQWKVSLSAVDGTSVTLSVTPSSSALIGKYNIYVETATNTADDKLMTHRHKFLDIITVLFNAWCKDDDVYLEAEAERDEYVLNESGRIWVSRPWCSRPWNFGQFEDVCLEAALYLLDKAEIFGAARSSPVHICRTLSAMANNNDEDNGVLEGRWTKTYPKNCTRPLAWTGSVAILEEFMRKRDNKQTAVRFGQCWVFSGLLTTLCRSLGIPTRSVTNFSSAHDTDASMTIDFHYDENDEPMEELNDSVWNFHVWNESWMKRSDLPDGYGGWQAHDSTPQELSQGLMQCGPASLQAIREGLAYLPYDVPFIFAEVNGDKINWRVKDDGSMEPINVLRNVIGKFISTKSVGSHMKNDVTHLYKHEEGSEAERKSVHHAFSFSSRKEQKVYKLPPLDVSFTLAPPEVPDVGDDVDVSIVMKNTSDGDRTIKAKLTAVVSFYTGVPSARVGGFPIEAVIPAQGEKKTMVTIKNADFAAILTPDATMQVYFLANIAETKRTFAVEESFTLVKPELNVTAPAIVDYGDQFEVTVSFKNSLRTELTNGILSLEAGKLGKPITHSLSDAIQPDEKFSHTFSLKPRRAGKGEVSVSFMSDQLTGLTGAVEVRVKYPQ